MSSYYLNNWVLVKHKTDYDESVVVLGGTSGGYLDSDTWRLSSPIKSVETSPDLIIVETSSGSHYNLPREREQLHISFIGIWKQLQDKYGEHVQIIKISEYLKMSETKMKRKNLTGFCPKCGFIYSHCKCKKGDKND